MTDTFTKAVVDCQTGIVTNVPMTEEEIEAHQQAIVEIAEMEANREASEAAKVALKESAKAKLIAGEPLTAEEAAVLVI
jgi:hypothetical protein